MPEPVVVPEEVFMQVVRGNPTPEELAAVIAVVASRSGAPARPSRPDRVSVWAQRARNIRRAPQPGTTSWRASTWPGAR
ncbi:acyl-CoA carboxylase subunit epsilon [Streptomyces capparidis]